MNILFLCVANSARSQLAEGLAQSLFSSECKIESAGSQPSGVVRPEAITALQEIGIDISQAHSKFYGDLPPAFLKNVDFIITLCADEVCPVVLAPSAKRIHWPLKDPAAAPETERLDAFRMTRDALRNRLMTFGQEHSLLSSHVVN